MPIYITPLEENHKGRQSFFKVKKHYIFLKMYNNICDEDFHSFLGNIYKLV